MLKLNEKDSYAVQCALELAAKQYAANEQELRAQSKSPQDGFARMADQFKRQREQCDMLCNEVQEHDFVVLACDSDAISSRSRMVVS